MGDNMERRLIVLDVDGTLMPATNQLDIETKNYLNKLEETGNIICLASQRGYHDLSIIHNDLGLKGPVISNNGGSLDFFDGTPSICMAIDNSIIKRLFKETKNVIESAFYSYQNKLFIFNKLDKLSFLYKIKPENQVIEGPFDEVDLDHPNSIYFILKNDLKKQFFDEIDSKYSEEIFYNEYGHDQHVAIVTVALKHTDKSYAILELLMTLGLSEENSIIFGDGEQDVEMLKLQATTFAMLNGCNEAKQAAKKISEFDNNHQGIMIELKKIIKE